MSDRPQLLAVDDTPESLAFLVETLTRAGYQVRPADSGELALAAASANPPDLILLDVRMPGLSGLEVCRRLKAQPATRDVAILLVSAFADVEEWVAGLEAGAADYITKPFREEELLRRVQTHLAVRRTAQTLARTAAELQQANQRLQAEVARREQAEAVLRENLEQAERSRRALLSALEDHRSSEAVRAGLEVQLLQSQKMEAVGQLAGGVAHDFNNMLSVILNYNGFALDRCPPGHPGRGDLLEVQKAAERASALTRQLLAFSRKQVLQPDLLDLNEVAQGVQGMLRRLIGEDIEYAQVLAPDLGWVVADVGQMEQVLLNLVVNARDAMPGGGRITVSTSNLTLDAQGAAEHLEVAPGPYVMLTVADDGVGMDPATQARIFEPFFTTKEKGKGTGLGLSMVYGIVHQSGGFISVKSILGAGSSFSVGLPRAVSYDPPGSGAEPAASRVHTGTETILLVEDEETLRGVARRILEVAGYTVLAAASGQEALQRCAEHAGPIDLLLTDVVMPRMTGPELARALATQRPATRLLYTSGYTDDEVVRRGVRAAELHFLPKPFTEGELLEKVREVLDGAEPRRWSLRPAGGLDELGALPFDPRAVRALPGALLDRLRRAVATARYDTVAGIVEDLRATAPEVAAGLVELADRYDGKRLRALLNWGAEEPADG